MSQNTIYISKENLLHNYHHLCQMAQHEVWPVVKSNAYGHGIEQVVACLQDISCEYFIVQNYFEAQEIWKHRDQQVLMLGTEEHSLYNSMDFKNITPTVGSIELLTHIAALKKTCPFI